MPLRLVDERLDQKHSHSSWLFFAGHFTVNVWRGRRAPKSIPIIDDLDLELVIVAGQHDCDIQTIIELVPVFDRVNACLSDGGFEIFYPVVRKAHHGSHSGGSTHRDLLESEL